MDIDEKITDEFIDLIGYIQDDAEDILSDYYLGHVDSSLPVFDRARDLATYVQSNFLRKDYTLSWTDIQIDIKFKLMSRVFFMYYKNTFDEYEKTKNKDTPGVFLVKMFLDKLDDLLKLIYNLSNKPPIKIEAIDHSNNRIISRSSDYYHHFLLRYINTYQLIRDILVPSLEDSGHLVIDYTVSFFEIPFKANNISDEKEDLVKFKEYVSKYTKKLDLFPVKVLVHHGLHDSFTKVIDIHELKTKENFSYRFMHFARSLGVKDIMETDPIDEYTMVFHITDKELNNVLSRIVETAIPLALSNLNI